MSVAAGPKLETDGLVLALDASNLRSFDGEDATTTWRDISKRAGRGRKNATINEREEFIKDDDRKNKRRSFELDGSNDYMTIPNVMEIGTGEFTMEFSVKTGDTSNFQYLVSNKDNFDGPFTKLGFDNTGKLRFYTESSGGTGSTFVTDSVYANDEFITVTFTRSGAVGKIYVDGVLVKTGTTRSDNIGNSTDNWTIGSGSSSGTDSFNGQISKVRVYDRELSARQIAQNFNGFKGVKYAEPSEPPSLYDFTAATFTTNDIEGPEGPSLAQAINGLTVTGNNSWTTNTAYFNTSNGIQQWTVPSTGTYTIEAAGSHSASRRTSGRGAILRGDFELTEGDIINIVVGQPELQVRSNTPTGGGGGTFVVKSVNPLSTTTAENILVIAGGGGGTHDKTTGYDQATADANFGPDGFPGTPNGSLGGTNGSGGSYPGGTAGGTGGAGYYTDGAGRTQYPSPDGDPPRSYINGAIGGGFNGSSASKGGFGGGGRTWYNTGWGGGGGGYSGGGTGSSSNYNGNAGGGGSINNGTNTANVGYNAGPGYVIIQR